MSEGRDRSDVTRRLHDLVRQGRSWSGNERNCCFLNTGQTRFANISGVSGIDFPDDARGISLVDWDHDGDLDVWVVNRNGPQVRYLRNDVPQDHHWLAVRLVGTTSNRDAIGARVEVMTKGQGRGAKTEIRNPRSAIVRSLRAGEGFVAQSSKWLHFGLGPATEIERLVVRWPGGDAQEFTDVNVDRHYRIVQDSDELKQWTRPQPAKALEPSDLDVPRTTRVAWSLLGEPLPFPKLTFETFDRTSESVEFRDGKCVLVNLWATWCLPCLKELHEFTQGADRLREAGINIVALSVDELDPSASGGGDPAEALRRLEFSFSTGLATTTLVDTLQLVQDELFDPIRPVSLPSSYLFNDDGHLIAVYKGSVSVDHLLADAATADLNETARRAESPPFPGRWFAPPPRYRLLKLASDLLDAGYLDEAVEFVATNRARVETDRSLPRFYARVGSMFGDGKRFEEAVKYFRRAVQLEPKLSRAHFALARTLEQLGRYSESIDQYRLELENDPEFAEAHNRLAIALIRQGQFAAAEPHFRRLVQLAPESATMHQNLASVLARSGKKDEAIQHYRKTLELDPDFVNAHVHLALALVEQGEFPEAVEHLNEVTRLQPTAPDSYYFLAQVEETAGNVNAAIEHYQRAIELAEAAGNRDLTTKIEGRLRRLESR
jgi:tetratricopeptide (TPR) repeat protein